MAAVWLAAARFGVDLLGAGMGLYASGAQARLAREQAKTAAFVERYQIRRSSEVAAGEMRRELGEAVGAQRAALTASGIGGRTARLIEMEAQQGFRRQDAIRREQEALGLFGADSRARQQVFGIQQYLRQMRIDTVINVLGSGLDTGPDVVRAREAGEAGS